MLPQLQRLMFVKTAWCDTYDGTQEPTGDHHYLVGNKGCERFNFRRCADGRFYAGIPGPDKDHLPRPDRRDGKKPTHGRTLVFIARPSTGPLLPVGIYVMAKFERQWRERPDYQYEPNFPIDNNGKRFPYFISANQAVEIPLARRHQYPISGDHCRRTAIVYLNRQRGNEAWRRAYAALAKTIVENEWPTGQP